MQLSERELEDIVGQALREYLDTGASWTAVCMNAAHTIAEAEAKKMRERLVCERRYIIRHADYPDPAAAHMMCSYLTLTGDSGPGHEGEYVWLDNKRVAKDGQLVTVTVRTREESGEQGTG